LSSDELLELERARLALRSYGIAADRGRIVREALAILLADFDNGGEQSLVAQRLRHDALTPDPVVAGYQAGQPPAGIG
jgi:hypothetical protein